MMHPARATALLALMALSALVLYEIPAVLGADRWIVRLANLWPFLAVAYLVAPGLAGVILTVAGLGLVGALNEQPLVYRSMWVLAQIVGAFAWAGWVWPLPARRGATEAIAAVGVLACLVGAGLAAWAGWRRGAGPVDPFSSPAPAGVADHVGLGTWEMALAVLATMCIVAVWTTRHDDG